MATDTAPESKAAKPVPTITIVRWPVREYMGTALVGVFLFLAAGRTDWIMG